MNKPVLKAGLAAFMFANVACSDADDIGTRAEATIIGNDGDTIGEASFIQGTEGVVLEVKVRNISPGKHGLHFHRVGICHDAYDFQMSGGHIESDTVPHGLLNPDGPHAGDMPNLIVHEDGTAHAEFYSELVSLNGRWGQPALLDDDGSALVIHLYEDDYKSQPIGGSGSRIGCGLITPVGG
ncbi:MAG: superoxide dismutase family protein [Parvularculales bacterium]